MKFDRKNIKMIVLIGLSSYAVYRIYHDIVAKRAVSTAPSATENEPLTTNINPTSVALPTGSVLQMAFKLGLSLL